MTKSTSTRKCECYHHITGRKLPAGCLCQCKDEPTPSTRKWEEQIYAWHRRRDRSIKEHTHHENSYEEDEIKFIQQTISSAVEQAREEGFLSGYLTGHIYDEKELALQIKLLKPTKAKR